MPQPTSPYSVDDPLVAIGPKANDLWKPVIAAVNGMACGGAFYLLGESEFVVAAATATFFDPHTTLRHGQRLRGGLHGAADAVRGGGPDVPDGDGGTAVGAARLRDRAWCRSSPSRPSCCRPPCARPRPWPGFPTEAVQGTVRSLWSAKQAALQQALAQAPHLVRLGNLPGDRQAELFAARTPDFRLR